MGIFEFLSGFGKKEAYQVYCQGCGLDMTAIGGYVLVDGRAYCGKPKPESRIGERCIAGGIPTPADTEELQRAIRKGHLTKYNPLEKKTDSNQQNPPRPTIKKLHTSDIK